MGITRRQKVGDGMNFMGVGDRSGTRLEVRVNEIGRVQDRKVVKFGVFGVENLSAVTAVAGGPYIDIHDGIRVAVTPRKIDSEMEAMIDYSATRHYDMEKVEY
jgi:hypothetical protein